MNDAEIVWLNGAIRYAATALLAALAVGCVVFGVWREWRRT